MTKSSTSILTLPPEVLEIVFCRVADIRSVLSLASTCHYVQSAYLGSQKQILLALHARDLQDSGLPSCYDAPILAVKAQDLRLYDEKVGCAVYNIDGHIWDDTQQKKNARLRQASEIVKEEVETFIRGWGGDLGDRVAAPGDLDESMCKAYEANLNTLRVDQALELHRLHRAIAFLVRQYKWDCTKRHPATSEERSNESPPLTQTSRDLENRRLFQAFYRWELWSAVVCGPPAAFKRWNQVRRPPSMPTGIQTRVLFPGAAEWEIEALACVAQYGRARWERISRELISAVKPESGRQDDAQQAESHLELDVLARPDSPDFFDQLQRGHDVEYFLDNLTSFGPRFLYSAVLLCPDATLSVDQKRDVIIGHLRLPCNSLSDALSHRDAPPPPATSQPVQDAKPAPAGWLWAWREEEDMYNETPIAVDPLKRSLREWGYVFWSEERLADWGFVTDKAGSAGVDSSTFVWSPMEMWICWRDSGKPV